MSEVDINNFDKAIEEAWPGSALAEALPYESWEKLKGESFQNYSAFCVYRDMGAERSVRKAVESVETDKRKIMKRYDVWRGWSSQYRWKERAADYDKHLERLKQTELRKLIEALGEKHRAVAGKMLDVVSKKLDIMNPEELTQGNVTEWMSTAIKAEREAVGLVAPNGKAEPKQGELNFVKEFEGL